MTPLDANPLVTEVRRQVAENIQLRTRIAELEKEKDDLLLYAQMACSKCQHNVHLKKLEMAKEST